MAASYIDRINDLSLTEDNGVIVALTRKAHVILGDGERSQDFQALDEVLAVLDLEGLTPKSRIGDIESAANKYRALYLAERTPSVMNDPAHFEVTLKYRHVMDGHRQQIKPTPTSKLYGKGRCSIVDKTTNFFYPFGDVSKPRQLITVSYQYPETEKGITNYRFPRDYPRVIFQGGEISLPFPQANNGFQCLVTTHVPYRLARQIIRHVNLLPWCGEPALFWICSEVSWELSGWVTNEPDPAPQYKMSFEFQMNSDTWDPFVVFNDQRDGKPPPEADQQRPDTLDANGVLRLVADQSKVPGDPTRNRPAAAWSVPALPRLDYNTFFESTIDGA